MKAFQWMMKAFHEMFLASYRHRVVYRVLGLSDMSLPGRGQLRSSAIWWMLEMICFTQMSLKFSANRRTNYWSSKAVFQHKPMWMSEVRDHDYFVYQFLGVKSVRQWGSSTFDRVYYMLYTKVDWLTDWLTHRVDQTRLVQSNSSRSISGYHVGVGHSTNWMV